MPWDFVGLTEKFAKIAVFRGRYYLRGLPLIRFCKKYLQYFNAPLLWYRKKNINI